MSGIEMIEIKMLQLLINIWNNECMPINVGLLPLFSFCYFTKKKSGRQKVIRDGPFDI